MIQLDRDFVRAYLEAQWFSRFVMGRDLEADEIAGMYLAERFPYPVAGKNLGAGFLRLGLEAVKWFHPSGSISRPEAKLYVIPRPGKRQICVDCDWGISVRVSENGKDLQDIAEVRDCPRVYVKPDLTDELIQVIEENGFNLKEESNLARVEVLNSLQYVGQV
ncbi:hypothetical protein L3N51_02107 [Metallosphaera sp. J1]|uniref:hypothetical protein n=1 Tax=Metallosphaera javensis (ex Hofmann et al. 2022) TaxID=99938 RepID=UPI001EDD555B|nr:hypothetical protein [Metallosphaera javensis (ex Hofmann et al. 2022)]MCG3109811.1 hypothetical protein [Metallosphaera javensis (ex Hofmann et al. 2022)]